jgi:hypothetical protein
MIARVRRHWNSHEEDEVELSKLEGFHWSSMSGGTRTRSPRPMIHAYIVCTDVPTVSHSGAHGLCPHRIKVCIPERAQEPGVFAEVRTRAEGRKK